MVDVILHMTFNLLPSMCIIAAMGYFYARLPWEGPEDDIIPPLPPRPENDALDTFSCLEEAGWNISGLSAQPFTGQLVAYLETPSEEPDMREYEACNPQNVAVSPVVIVEATEPAMAYEETVSLRPAKEPEPITDEELDAWIAHFSYNPTIPEVGSDESTFFGQLGRYESFFLGGGETVVEG